MPPSAAGRLVLVATAPESTEAFAGVAAFRVSTPEQIVAAFADVRPARWVAPTVASLAGPLARAASARHPRERRHEVLVLSGPGDAEQGAPRELLQTLFAQVVVVPARRTALGVRRRASDQLPPASYLPDEELAEVLAHEHPGDYVIGGVVDLADEVVLLRRGSLESLVVPFAFFTPAANGLQPDFDDFEVTDYGQTLRFGAYEASVDVVLYDQDQEYRRRAKTRERTDDESFGAAFRRLRLLRGLRQGDFPPLDERTIRRIEQNAVEALHADTRSTVAARLGVPFEEIASY